MAHVKNAESYSRLVDICTGLGGIYNPGQESLQIDALRAQQDQVKKVLDQVIETKTAFDNVVNQRKRAFQGLRPLTASVLRTLEASGATPERLADARAFVHQLLGVSFRSRAQPTVEDAAPIRKRSTLQLAYVSKADSFARLIKVVETEPLYKTNEMHLRVEGLQAALKQLEAFNDKVSKARVSWSNALIQRNEVMYGPATSFRRTAIAARKYVRALFGLKSEQYALLKVLRFMKPE